MKLIIPGCLLVYSDEQCFYSFFYQMSEFFFM